MLTDVLSVPTKGAPPLESPTLDVKIRNRVSKHETVEQSVPFGNYCIGMR